jgi:hypothetical protein
MKTLFNCYLYRKKAIEVTVRNSAIIVTSVTVFTLDIWIAGL